MNSASDSRASSYELPTSTLMRKSSPKRSTQLWDKRTPAPAFVDSKTGSLHSIKTNRSRRGNIQASSVSSLLCRLLQAAGRTKARKIARDAILRLEHRDSGRKPEVTGIRRDINLLH